VENADGRIRRWLPPDTPVGDLRPGSMAALCQRLDTTPRKCLGYATPAEAFTAETEGIT
jgi:IS30 family transposase